jgi:hypothetical protein
MNFNQLYNEFLQIFLTEGLDYSFLTQLNTDVKNYDSSIKNFVVKKEKFKPLSKKLILHLVNGNYENIITKTLPELKKIAGRMSDEEFKEHLTQHLSSLSSDRYQNFWKVVNNSILKLSSINRGDFDFLKKLRPEYIMSF